METVQGNLTIINANTESPLVYWNGKQVAGVTSIRVHNEDDEHLVKIVVDGDDEATYFSMIEGGVIVRKAKK
jgi:hypothetical protein